MSELIPLHTHTCYSLLDALIKVEDYVEWGKNNNMPALAITDHGSMGGTLKFYEECNKQGIKPILGMEAYTTLDLENQSRDNYHLVLLAKNKQKRQKGTRFARLSIANDVIKYYNHIV